MVLTGKITSADGNAERISWDGFQVVITQTAQVEDVTKSIDRIFAVREDGTYLLEFEDKVPADAMIGVIAPTNQLLVRGKLSGLIDANSTTLHPLAVKRPDLNLMVAPPAPQVDVTVRVSGRVFVASAGSLDHSAAAALEVRILGSEKADAPLTALSSGITDRSGYFAGAAQKRRLVTAVAETGSGSAIVRHNLHLTAAGWLPEPILLFVEPRAAGQTDCECDLAPPTTPGADELALHSESFAVD